MNRKIITSATSREEYQLVEVEPGEWWYENSPDGGDVGIAGDSGTYPGETERVLVLAEKA